MRKIYIARLFSVIMIALMVITDVMSFAGPFSGYSYAAEGEPALEEGEAVHADGGACASNAADDFVKALGSGNAEVLSETKDGRSIVTVTLKNDIVLEQALRITHGAWDDKVVLDLAGHSITGAEGKNSDDSEDSRGVSPIEISAGGFDVEIKGPGSITGGKGAVYESYGVRSGANGGNAVTFVESEYEPLADNGRLLYGLTVTGGAVLTGGSGADISAQDILNNIEKYSGSAVDFPAVSSGSGCAGIGQLNAGMMFGNQALVYSRISVEDAVVNGGNGGRADMSSGITPTKYHLMTSQVVQKGMTGKNIEYINDVLGRASFSVGKGGDGIRTGCGRKYIYTGKESEITGGSPGTADYGKNRTINRLSHGYSAGDARIFVNAGDAGDGIAVWVSDLGITNVPVGYKDDEWKSKTKDSDDMGIFVEGEVTGGSCPDVKALNESAGSGGAGIALYGDYERYGAEGNGDDWGIVDVEGTVKGGNGGSAVSGAPGSGGDGIYESYSLDAEGDTMGDQGTNYYIVNGTVTGGNGGSSFGTGGNGIKYSERYRAFVNLKGDGTAIAGDAGSATDRDDPDVSKSYVDPIYLVKKDDPYYKNNVELNTQDGALAKVITTKRIDVTAEMTKFSQYPNTSTKLSCKVARPSGYTGDVYISWAAKITVQGNDPESCYIESSGTDMTSFNMLSNSAYKYLAYEGYEYEALGWHRYTDDILTTDRIKERISIDNSTTEIWCYVLLEDGSWGKSNVMTFDKNGWSGGSGSETGPTDAELAEKVNNLIQALPDAATISLADEDAVTAARNAYNTLETEQKVLVDKDLLEKLKALEDRIEELKKPAYDVVNMIEMVSDPEFMDTGNAEEVAAIRKMLTDVMSAYNALSDDQKRIVEEGGHFTYLMGLLNAFNVKVPEDPIEIETDPIKVVPEVVPESKSLTYNGKARTPGVTVLANGTPVAESMYDVTYAAGRKAVGTYKITVRMKGMYAGTNSASFDIVPKGATISKPKAAKKALTAKWKPQKSKMSTKRIAGYQVQASLKKSFKSGVKKKTVKGYKKKSVKIKKLKSRKTYYVRVRTYMKVKGKTYYSKWSKVKKTRVK